MRKIKKYTALLGAVVLLFNSFCIQSYAGTETYGDYTGLLELPYEYAAGEVCLEDGDAAVYSELVGGSMTDSRFDPRLGKENFADNLYSVSRLQGSYNTCWSFASLACAEASVNKHSGIYGQEAYDLQRDFSEAYFAKLIYNKEADYSDRLGNCKGTEYYISSSSGSKLSLSQRISLGASLMNAQDVMAFGVGPVAEEKYPYSKLISGGMPEGNTYESDAVFESGSIVPTYDHEAVKKMILRYGGVATGYYNMDTGFKSVDGEKYYNYPEKSINHGIVLVGWDDNCPKENFKKQPSKDGAWLVRNSQRADYAYFWMSYDTLDYYKDNAKTASNVNGYVYNVRPKIGKERVYEYDSAINNYRISNYKKVLVTFDAKETGSRETEYINGVTFKAYGAGTVFTASVYKNTPENMTGSTSPETSADVTLETDGYIHLAFDKEVPVNEGDKFTVMMQMDGTGRIFYTGNSDSALADNVIIKTKFNIGDTVPTDYFTMYDSSGEKNGCEIGGKIYIPRLKVTTVIRDSVTGEIVPEGEMEPTATATPTTEPSPTATVTATPTTEPSPTATVTATDAPSPTGTESPIPTVTEAPSPTGTETPSPTGTEEPTPTGTEAPSPTGTESPTPTGTEAPIPTVTVAPSPTGTEEPTPTGTETPSPTGTEEPTPTVTDAPSPTGTEEPTPTGTEAPSPTGTEEPTPTGTEAPTPTATENPEPTATVEPTAEPTEVPTATPAPTAEPTITPTAEPIKEVSLSADKNNAVKALVGEVVEVNLPESEKTDNFTITGISSKKAKVVSGNTIQILKYGTIKIKTIVNGKKYVIKLKIPKPKIAGGKKLELAVGKTGKIKVSDALGEIKYASSNPAVASVDDMGEVKALSTGKSKILVTVGGLILKAKIEVR